MNGGPSARVLAGGTDLIVIARSRRRAINLMVDIKHIPETMQLSWDASKGLTVGAATPLYQIYQNADIQKHWPGLVDCSSLIGGTAVQGRASLGGNLCNSSPSGDTITMMMVLEGTATIVGPNGERTVPIDQFCTGPGANVLQPGELLISMTFPVPAANSGTRFLRFIPRNEMDIAVVNAAANVRMDGNRVAWARVAVGAAAPTVLLVDGAASAVVGKELTDATLDAAAAASSAAVSPIDDMRGTIVQRRHLAGVFTKRVLQDAVARARGEQVGH